MEQYNDDTIRDICDIPFIYACDISSCYDGIDITCQVLDGGFILSYATIYLIDGSYIATSRFTIRDNGLILTPLDQFNLDISGISNNQSILIDNIVRIQHCGMSCMKPVLFDKYSRTISKYY